MLAVVGFEMHMHTGLLYYGGRIRVRGAVSWREITQVFLFCCVRPGKKESDVRWGIRKRKTEEEMRS